MHEAKEKIIREMALGKGALDLGVLFRGGKYAVKAANSRTPGRASGSGEPP
jgi:hypothetical protein